MKDQLEVAISAVLAAKHEISRLKQEFEANDERRTHVDDAEQGAAWIIKQLSNLGQPTGRQSVSCR